MNIEHILREFIPHSASYCIEPLAKALEEELINNLPKLTGYSGEARKLLSQYREEVVKVIKGQV